MVLIRASEIGLTWLPISADYTTGTLIGGFVRFITSLILAALLLFSIGCGSDKKAAELKAKQDAAVVTAMADFQQFRQATTGFQAEALRLKIMSGLKAADLKLGAISVTESELQLRQDELYDRDSANISKKLQNTHGSAQTARELANQVRMLKNKAGRPVSPDLEKGLELSVARNMSEEATAIRKAHGVRQPIVVAQHRKVVRTARR